MCCGAELNPKGKTIKNQTNENRRQTLRLMLAMKKESKRGFTMKKKTKTTYEKFIENKHQKKILDREYRELLISELLLAAMEEDHISVRKLAAEAEVSPTIIQSLKSGKKTNITIETLSRILDVVGYQIILAPKSGAGPRLKMA